MLHIKSKSLCSFPASYSCTWTSNCSLFSLNELWWKPSLHPLFETVCFSFRLIGSLSQTVLEQQVGGLSAGAERNWTSSGDHEGVGIVKLLQC